MSCYRDIPLAIIWGWIPLEVIFILGIYKILCGHLSIGLKLVYGPIIDYLFIPLLYLGIYKIWFGHLIISLKVEFGPKIGDWDILLLLFWGLLPLEVILFLIWFGLLSISLQLKYRPINGYWDWSSKLKLKILT